MFKTIHILEIFVWLIILIGISLFFYSNHQHKVENQTLIPVVFDDVDGLEIGAPVNCMGMDIGSVAKFKQDGRHIIVYIALEDPKFKIPAGSIMTIQFTGLVGAKTLELSPPAKAVPKDTPEIIVNEPIRITYIVEALAKTYESVITGSKNIAGFLNDNRLLLVKQRIKDANQFTKRALVNVNETDAVMKDVHKSFLPALVDIDNSLNNYISTTNEVIHSMNVTNYDQETRSSLKSIEFTMKYAYNILEEGNYKRWLDDFIFAGKSLNRRINTKQFQSYKQFKVETYFDKLDSVNDKLYKTKRIIIKADNATKNINLSDAFKKLLENLSKYNKEIKQWEEKI